MGGGAVGNGWAGYRFLGQGRCHGPAQMRFCFSLRCKKSMTLPVGRGFDVPPITAKWKAIASETPDRSSGWTEGWAASAMLMGAQVQTAG